MIKINPILKEIERFEKNSAYLPQKRDIEVLKKIRALWVISGSGSYLKPLINTPSDKANLKNSWYHGTDKARLDFAERWLIHLRKVIPQNRQPILIYNGLLKQNQDLTSAIEKKIYSIPLKGVYFAPGKIERTVDQVKKFSFPPEFKVKDSYLALITHAPHMARVLRFINKNKEVFKGIKVLALPIKIKDAAGEREFAQGEIKGILAYIDRGQASPNSYPYKLLKPLKVKVATITPKDLMAVFNLSNSPSVRKNSFNQNKIELATHKKWFKNKLQDRNSIMLKATIEGKLVGQVRLDIENNQALIGVSIDENFRGLGIGSKLLSAAISQAKKRKLSVIEALIKPQNNASVRLFEKNGWVFDKEIISSDNKALRYTYKINRRVHGV